MPFLGRKKKSLNRFVSKLVVTAAVKQVTWSECECVHKVETDSANKDVNNVRFWQGFFVK